MIGVTLDKPASANPADPVGAFHIQGHACLCQHIRQAAVGGDVDVFAGLGQMDGKAVVLARGGFGDGEIFDVTLLM